VPIGILRRNSKSPESVAERDQPLHPAVPRDNPRLAIFLGLLALVAVYLSPGKLLANQDAKPQQSGDESVRVSVHNVKYRFAENVSVQINNLSGAIVPIGQHAVPVFDDKESFKVRIDSAEVAMSLQDLANLLNQFVFERPGSQLSGISVTTTGKGHLKVKGRLKDKGDIPFETEGALVPMPDGKLRLHADKVRALKIPVKGLMDALGIEVDNVIKSGKVPGLTVEENDLMFDLEQILPAPRIEGKVTKVRVEPDMIVETIAGDAKNVNDAKPMPKYPGNYIAFRGGRVEFWKVAFAECDIVVSDMDPADPLDFFLDHYREQVAAGYTKVSESFQVRTFLKDYGKLAPRKSTPSAKSKN
jgi:hypothetical protein